MEYQFIHIVSPKITRLLRPKLALDTNINNSLVVSTFDSTSDDPDTLCTNDIGENCSTFDDMLTFPTKFGYSLYL